MRILDILAFILRVESLQLLSSYKYVAVAVVNLPTSTMVLVSLVDLIIIDGLVHFLRYIDELTHVG